MTLWSQQMWSGSQLAICFALNAPLSRLAPRRSAQRNETLAFEGGEDHEGALLQFTYCSTPMTIKKFTSKVSVSLWFDARQASLPFQGWPEGGRRAIIQVLAGLGR